MTRVKCLPNIVSLLSILVLLAGCGTPASPTASPDRSADYFGLALPGLSPERFAPGVLPPEGGVMHSYPAFSPDGTEVYFSTYFPDQEPRLDVIMFMAWQGEGWSAAQVAPFSGDVDDDWPWFSRDGNRLYFSSQRAPEGGGRVEEYGLWYVERVAGGWSPPRHVASPADFGGDEGPVYVAAVFPGGYGDMDIYRLAYADGTYSMPENLGPAINTEAEEYGPCAAPDETYLIFARYQETGGRTVDLHVSFRQGDGTWSQAQNMGERMAAFRGARFPGLSPDGSSLFFVAEGGENIYWVDAGVIEQFRPEQ